MLRNGGHSMHQGEDTRLRSGNPAASRERKHLALCINSQEEVRRYHRFCNHSGGQAVKQERSSSRRREEDFDNKIQRSEQQHLEVKATVIQRAWRAKQGQKKNVQSLTVPSSLRMTTTISAPCTALEYVVDLQDDSQLSVVLWELERRIQICYGQYNELPGGEQSGVEAVYRTASWREEEMSSLHQISNISYVLLAPHHYRPLSRSEAL
uniref:Uncharacterized protein n=1 Tax=Knipowitschia caucasica TaxID=637954 RepID=A0AAV2IZD5_KNICA